MLGMLLLWLLQRNLGADPSGSAFDFLQAFILPPLRQNPTSHQPTCSFPSLTSRRSTSLSSRVRRLILLLLKFLPLA